MMATAQAQQAVATLVIVDDHPLFRGAMRQALSGSLDVGPQGIGPVGILEAGNFNELKALLNTDGDFDLILLDLSMPGVSGFSGLLALRAEHPTMPVVIVSANDDPATVRRAIELG
ncbi:MAG: response regulator transcription factor, partial [Pseudomonadota bacterium]